MAILDRRRAAIGVFLLSMLAGVTFAAALMLPIAPLLPSEGDATCYAATFDGGQELRFGWAQKVDEGAAPVLAMSVRLSHPPPIEPGEDDSPSFGYGYLYDGRIVADIKGKGRYNSPTQCGNSRAPRSSFDTGIYCGIDCDGGVVWLSRVPGRRALEVTWDAGQHLRMSSCGGGGAYLRAEGSARTFRLEPVALSDCDTRTGRD